MMELLKFDKDKMSKLLVILAVSAIIFLTFSMLGDSSTKHQISDDNGSTEATLCNILSDIDGVGKVSVMIDYDQLGNVSGVIITCEGGSNNVTKNNIIKGVSALFNIPTSNVTVFSKSKGGISNEEN